MCVNKKNLLVIAAMLASTLTFASTCPDPKSIKYDTKDGKWKEDGGFWSGRAAFQNTFYNPENSMAKVDSFRRVLIFLGVGDEIVDKKDQEGRSLYNNVSVQCEYNIVGNEAVLYMMNLQPISVAIIASKWRYNDNYSSRRNYFACEEGTLDNCKF